MRVVYLIGQLRRGGAEQQLYYLLQYTPHKSFVISLEPHNAATYWADPIESLGVTVYELPARLGRGLSRLRFILHLIRLLKPDLIHIFTDGVGGIYGRLGAMLSRIPCVIVGERRHPSADPTWYSQIKRLFLNRFVNAVVANAQTSHDYLVAWQGVPESKAFYFPNGIDLAKFSLTHSTDRALFPVDWHEAIIVITVASLLPKKDPATFIKVAIEVCRQHPQARFVYVGKGPLLEEIQSQAKSAGIFNQIWFAGERLDIPALLQSADIFLLTSKNEGTSNAIMEAMASQLPCVATDVGDTYQLVADGVTGYLCEVGQVECLTASIVRLIKNQPLRIQLGQAGYQHIQTYGLQQSAGRYIDLYAKLCNSSV